MLKEAECKSFSVSSHLPSHPFTFKKLRPSNKNYLHPNSAKGLCYYRVVSELCTSCYISKAVYFSLCFLSSLQYRGDTI